MEKQKVGIIEKKFKGSILAYSLIILTMMIAIAASISVTSIIAKKSASGTEFSMQSLQTADSGVNLALKKINIELKKPNPGTISQTLAPFACNIDKSIGNDAGPADSVYELSFFREDGSPLNCDDEVSLVANIKSVGAYKNTIRSVSVAVAATGGDVGVFTFTTNAGNCPAATYGGGGYFCGGSGVGFDKDKAIQINAAAGAPGGCQLMNSTGYACMPTLMVSGSYVQCMCSKS